ncbi:MAG TPA: putative sulfate exporter family transporter [Candidatus Sulfotelmatobacter sp.]|jgi:uncharacterized integral membrane protein (TIGR00698 family)|nr:putative sulfate exporter family transporter [Candidatus Sulfotelmatobacter sp.]
MDTADTAALPQAPVTAPAKLLGLLPGVLLSAGLAGAAMTIRKLPGLGNLSPAIIAILLGIVLRQIIGMRPMLRDGLGFSMRTLLRAAVVLLGLQVTVGQILGLGLPALLAVAAGLLACFGGTVWLGARLGVEPKLARLIATGTAVCGASAVVAANSVTKGKDEDVAYALAAVTLLGTLAMIVQPALSLMLGLDANHAGIWLGASLHEVAQVVGAATQLGDNATRTATIAKMARILLLAPLVLAMAAHEHRKHRDSEEPHAKIPVPWFVFGFLALAGLASSGMVPAPLIKETGLLAGAMLAAALGAMGFGMDLRALHRKGLRPMVLAVSSWLMIGAVSLGLVQLLG